MSVYVNVISFFIGMLLVQLFIFKIECYLDARDMRGIKISNKTKPLTLGVRDES